MFQCAADADFFSSPLLKGSATHSMQTAPPLRQKPAILVSQVKSSRSRWMDLQRASDLELDAPGGVTYVGNTFYQLNTNEYKTSKSGGKSHLVLPFTTSEVNALLAKVAKQGEPVPPSRPPASVGWPKQVSPPLRKLLGYHVDAAELSVNTHSRDLLAPPLRELVRVLSSSASGAFSPDTTRSGYFAFDQAGDGAPSAVMPQPHAERVSTGSAAMTTEPASGPADPQLLQTSDSDSSSSESAAPAGTQNDFGDPDESPAAALATFHKRFFSVQLPFLLVQHLKLRTIHIAGGYSEERLLCGRANSDRFVHVGQMVHQPFPRCKQYFRASGKHDER